MKGVKEIMKKFPVVKTITKKGIRQYLLSEELGNFIKIRGFKFFMYSSLKGFYVVDVYSGITITPPQSSKKKAIELAKNNIKKFASLRCTLDYIDFCQKYQKMKKYVQLEFNF